MFSNVSHFHPSLAFAGAYQIEATYGFKSGCLLGLPQNIRLGWKWLTLANTLAYYHTAIKSLTAQALKVHWIRNWEKNYWSNDFKFYSYLIVGWTNLLLKTKFGLLWNGLAYYNSA